MHIYYITKTYFIYTKFIKIFSKRVKGRVKGGATLF